MDNETRDAAWKYAQCRHIASASGQDEIIRGFMAGAGWALRNLRWIPVTESLPNRGDKCLFIVAVENSHDNGRMLGGTYTGNPEDFTRYEFGTPGVCYTASHWCPYPEVLLNVPIVTLTNNVDAPSNAVGVNPDKEVNGQLSDNKPFCSICGCEEETGEQLSAIDGLQLCDKCLEDYPASKRPISDFEKAIVSAMPPDNKKYNQRVKEAALGMCYTLFQDGPYGESDYKEFAIPVGERMVEAQADAVREFNTSLSIPQSWCEQYLSENGYVPVPDQEAGQHEKTN